MKQRITDTTAAKAPTRMIGITLVFSFFILVLLPLNSHGQQVSNSGFTEPYFDALLGISVTGRVAKIHLPEGTTVEKGQVILLPMSK